MKLLTGLTFLLLVLLSWIYFDWEPLIDNPELIRDTVRSYSLWAPLAFVLLAVAFETILSPGAPFTIAGGLLFGAVYGSILSIFSSVAAAVIIFWILRYSSLDFFVHYFHNRFELVRRYNSSLLQNGFWHVLFIRLLPVIPGNLINVGYGMSHVRFRDYFWGTILGNLPSTIVLAWLGTRLFVWTPRTVLLVLALGIVLGSLIGLLYQRYWRRPAQTV